MQARTVGQDERDTAGRGAKRPVVCALEVHPDVDERDAVLERQAVQEPARAEVVGAAEDNVAAGEFESDLLLERALPMDEKAPWIHTSSRTRQRRLAEPLPGVRTRAASAGPRSPP